MVVHDASMAPTLEPGDRLLVDSRAYRDRLPAVGELVVLTDPERSSRWLVKRVAGVGPSRLWIDPEGGVPREPRPTAPSNSPDPPEIVVIPPGYVYVTGDAAELSRDSRRFGPVPIVSLVGRAFRCYAPAERRREL